MSEMIERVARALFADHWQNDPELIPIAWEDASDWLHDVWHRSARAAIEAMREPTERMIEVGRWPAEDDGPLACWQAMIDAALSPNTNPETKD